MLLFKMTTPRSHEEILFYLPNILTSVADGHGEKYSKFIKSVVNIVSLP